MMNKKAGKDGATGLEIAVIGMAGRFPGAGNIETFWENLEKGIESICFFSDEELKTESAAAGEFLKHPNYIKACAVLDGIEYFDAPYFDYTPGEAIRMDPQVRIFHECVWAALEDAGYCPEIYKGPIGLFAGAGRNFTWEARSLLSGADPMEVSQFSDKDSLCTHVSYKLDLKGPASLVQTACSTSLTAVHQACRALLTGDCKIAIAGGVRAPVPQKQGYLYHEGMIMSPDGHSRAFDARVSGVVGGSGVGVVVLKLLKDARAHRDHIYAVIKGTAINNDGKRKVGYTAPSVEGQAEVIKTALRMARVEPETVSYVETHGTATPLGDMVEIEALKLAFNSNKKGFCAIGSVKTNVGHLDAAAGVTGLIKAILCLYHRLLPPTLHFVAPNPRIDLENSPFYVNNRLTPWKNENRDYPLRTGVSSFGIGGTNIHVVLEEAQEPEISSMGRPWKMIAWSAKTEEALRRGTRNLAEHFKKHPEINLADAAYTLHVGRRHHRCRRMAVCSDTADAVNVLSDENRARMKTYVTRGEDIPLVFMFPGQGSQYVNMGLDLYKEEPEFQKIMNHCFEILHSLMGFDLKKILYPDFPDSAGTPSILALEELPDLERYDINQPLIFAFEYALAKLLMSWGIMPTAMIGYSLGEYTAASLSGVFSLEDALELMVFRGRLMHEMPAGAMLSVPLPEEQLIPLLSHGKDGDISLAVVNEDACIVSGTPEAVRHFEEKMKTRRLMCMRVNVNRAGHSLILDSALRQFKERLGRVTLNKPEIPFVSGITGTWVKEEEVREVRYWVRHLRETIRFADGIKELAGDKRSIFVEVGPGRDMGILARRTIGEQAGERIVGTVRQARKNEPDSCYLLRKIGQLWLYGIPIDWQAFYSPGKRFRIPLPTYSFDKRRFWLEEIPFSANLWNISAGEAAGEAPFTGKKSSLTDRTHLGMDSVYAAPESEIEKKLVNIWEKFFGVQRLGIDDDFFDLGGDSLKAMKLLAEVHKNLDARIQMELFFKHSTIRELSLHLENAGKDKYESIAPVEEKEYYVLSPGQKRSYILQQMGALSTAYNELHTIPLDMGVDPDRLEKTFKKLIEHHESLRTFFVMREEEPVQRVYGAAEVKFELQRLTVETGDYKGLITSFVRPFDLSRAPLFRAGLIMVEEKKYILIVDIHHIITDGSSMILFRNDFQALYGGGELTLLRLRYRDYSEWLNREEIKESLKSQETYWIKRFAADIPVLNLPYDFPRPVIQSFEGRNFGFLLDAAETRQIRSMASSEGCTLYMVLLALFNILLSKLSGQEEIIAGTPVAGRRHADLQGVIGMFVNTLAMKNIPKSTFTFPEFLKDVKKNTLDAFENQEFPFEELVEKVEASINRDLGRNPLFDVMFALQNQNQLDFPIEIPVEEKAEEFVSSRSEITTAKFDLSFHGVEMGDRVFFWVEYCTKLFKEDTIRQYVRYWRKIIASVGENPGRHIGDIEIIDAEEKAAILEMSWGKRETLDSGLTIHRLFEEQAVKIPQNIALTASPGDTSAAGTEERKRESVQITFSELNLKSNQLAHVLRKKGVKSNTVVGLMVERSIEMVIGILGILKAGGAYLPIDIDYPEHRKSSMLKDSGVKLLLGDTRADTTANTGVNRNNNIDIEILDPRDENLYTGVFDNPGHINKAWDALYVIYTSGSTGKPKGVVLEHKNLLNLIRFQYGYTNIDFSRVLQFATICFDVSFQEIFSPLLAGGELVVADKESRSNFDRLFTTVRKHEIKTLFLPAALVKVLGNEHGNVRLIPRCVDHIVTAGEQLAVTRRLDRYLSTHGICLHNHYGPTETHVVTTFTMKAEDKKTGLPSIGRPVTNTCIYIMDKGDNPVPVGVPGELAIGGMQVARGYLNNPELTAERFINQGLFLKKPPLDPAKTFDKKAILTRNTNTNTLYRTGDLARWLINGCIEFLGRLDTQVKIRGYRVEPGEIENRLMEIDAINQAVVITREDGAGQKYLCAYVVFSSGLEKPGLSSVKEMLSGVLPDYMIPAHITAVDKIPLTPNGKVDRKVLLSIEPELGGHELEPPVGEVEKTIAGIWAEVLKVPAQRIGRNSNFFELGGHSLNAVVVIARIHKALSVKPDLTELFKTPDIKGLAEYVKGAIKEKYYAIEPVEEKEYYPLSSAQKRLFVLQGFLAGNVVYNMPRLLNLGADIDVKRVEQTFRNLIRRHESLRTSFHMIDDEPVQKVHDEVELKIEYYDLAPEGKGKIQNSFVRPFDLTHAPLLRVGLVRPSCILMVDMHHIISDAVSEEVLVEDFTSLYSGRELPSLRLQYRDFAAWQTHEKQKDRIAKQEAYWIKEMAGEIPVLDLPIDYPRPETQSFEGCTIGFFLDREQTLQLKKLASRQNVTLYMLMLAVFNVLLSRLGRNEEIIVGTPIAGRRHADLQNIIGMFVNTLVVKNYPHGGKSFEQFLKEVKSRTLTAFENQECQFEELVNKLDINRDVSRNPLFDVMFTLRKPEASERPETAHTPGHQEIIDPISRIAKFDITLTIMDLEDRLLLNFEYCTRLFKIETIRRFMAYIKRIIAVLVRNPALRTADVEIMDEKEKNRVLFEFNRTASPYPGGRTIHELFEEQAARTPDGVSVVGDGSITYAELNRKSNQLAQLLKEKGVLADSIIGIMIGRSVEMIIGILGILKAGGAYLPIEPDYPQERIDYMLKDSGAKLLVTTTDLEAPDFPLLPAAGHRQPATSLAYIIYTSGTTGRPKGTLISHYNAVRVVRNTNYIRITGNDRVLQLSNYAFDGSVFDIYGALLNGAALVMIKKEDVLSANKLAEYIKKHGITVFFITTALFNTLVEVKIDCFEQVRKALFGGEKVSVKHSKKALEYLGKDKIIHVYGPTETTVYATYYPIDKIEANSITIPIGKPIANTRVYVLDKYLKPVPLMVCGELYIGGDGVARGYLNQPELTAERFINQGLFLKKPPLDPAKTFDKKAILTRNTNTNTLYRTGDLVRCLPEGNIEFVGRIDQQVKIRGFRIELSEIENHLLNHKQIKEVVVIARERVFEGNNRDQYLCAYLVPDNEIDSTELKVFLSRSLPDYMIPSYFIPIEKIPLTPNNKIDRKRLPEPEIVPGSDFIGPRDELEERMVDVWAGVLGIAKEKISVSADFFELGGHSLKATTLAARIHKVFNTDVPLEIIFRRPTIRELAGYIADALEVPFISIQPEEKKEYYPLSAAQKRMYVLQQIEPESIAYNMPAVMILEGKINGKHLENTFKKLINRHESLRTSFEILNGQPIQRIHDDVDFEIEYFGFNIDRVKDVGDGSSRSPAAIENIIQDFIRPFNLSRVTQLRVGLIKTNEEEHILVADMHHIISDGLSMDILIKDLVRFYSGETLPALKLQYKDFSQWQNNRILSGRLKKQEDYWLHEFKKEPPIGELPTDYKRPVKRSFAGSSVTFTIPAEETMRLKELAQKEHATMFMVLLALYNILLFKLSQQEDITVGTIAAGRRHPDLENIIGVFVNTLALRNYPKANQPFCEFLRKVRKRALEAFDNQDYQFEDLVEKIMIEREAGRNPLFDAAFSFIPQGIDKSSPLAPAGGVDEGKNNLKVKAYNREQPIQAKFDLLMTALDKGGELVIVIGYSTELFNKETIKRFTKYFKEIVSGVTANESIQLKNINMSHDLLIASPRVFQDNESDFDF